MELQLQHQSSNEYSGLISFRIDWLDLFAVQGTLKSLLQHHNSKASILWHSAFFIVQLSHSYMTTGKTIALTRWTFVDKVISLLFNMLFAAVAAKLFQSCPTLCDSMDGSPPGSSVHRILQARVLEWVAISFSQNPLTNPTTSCLCPVSLGASLFSLPSLRLLISHMGLNNTRLILSP